MKQRKELKEINALCSREKSRSGPSKRQTIKHMPNKEKHNNEERDNGFHGSVVEKDQSTEEKGPESNYISIPTETVSDILGYNNNVDEIESEKNATEKIEGCQEEIYKCDILDVDPTCPKETTNENIASSELENGHSSKEREEFLEEKSTPEEVSQHDNENPELETIKEANEVSEKTADEMPKQKLNNLRPIKEEGEETSKISNEVKETERSHDLVRLDESLCTNNEDDQTEKTEQKMSRRNSTGKVMKKKLLDKRPASSAERTQRYEQMFDRRSYSVADVVRFKTNNSKTMSPRKSPRDMFCFTKRELEWYLPRKSNFDCHDKALKDAGHETEEKINKMEERKKRIMEKLQREKEARLRAKGIFPEVSNGTDKKEETKIISGDNTLTNSSFVDINNDEDENENDIDNIVTAVEINSHNAPVLQRHSSALSKRTVKGRRRGHHDDDEDDVRVDYQPLLLYLKYVNENPNEFLSHQKTSTQIQYLGQKANQRTQRMAEIIEKKHRQGNVVSCKGSVLLQAVKDIRPRFTDPGQWTIATKERNLMNNISALNSRKDPPFPNQKQEVSDSNQNTEEPKTEFEKEKAKLDKWLKTVSTAQLNKAKELALKELGEEDRYQTKWWNALQTCSYLRQKGMKDCYTD